jgi:hypothetical protein
MRACDEDAILKMDENNAKNENKKREFILIAILKTSD